MAGKIAEASVPTLALPDFEGIRTAISVLLSPAAGEIYSRFAEPLTQGGGHLVWLEISKVGKYSLTVLCGLTIHAVIILPLILHFLARRNPLKYGYGVMQAIATAFSTASSSATLPVTLDCVQKNNGVNRKAASFVLPLGATINMDGTALYEAVAAIFIAQLYGIELTFCPANYYCPDRHISRSWRGRNTPGRFGDHGYSSAVS